MSIKVKVITDSGIDIISQEEIYNYFQELDRTIPLSTGALYFYMIWLVDQKRCEKLAEEMNKEV